MRTNTIDDFHSKYVAIEPGGCWVWTGYIEPNGYGRINFGGCRKSAHRLSWEIHCGEITNGLHVLHRCDMKCCVNPSHLFLGTNTDNVRDRDAKGRNARHENHSNAKLNIGKVREIRSLAGKMPQRKTAERFGIHQSNVWRIIRELTWRVGH